MSQDRIIYKGILENMTDGVMTIGLDGRIITFNEAAEKILNLGRDEVLGRPFGEIFLAMEGNDDFNQTILNAVYDSATTHNSTVGFFNGRRNLVLSVTTSFLRTDEAGGKKNEAVIVVFSDRTEVEKLRETEAKLSEEIKAQHKKLQDSYLELEDANAGLQAALKKVHMIRIAATAFVIVLFLTVGVITWIKASPGKSAPSQPRGRDDRGPASFIAAPSTLTDSISLKGTLKPIKIVNVTSPFSGTVKEKLFEYGQMVTKGQLLLRMDTSETEQKYRDAKAAFIEANEKLRQVLNWSDSDEMAKANRNLAQAKRSFQESEFLFKKGIESANDYESKKKSYEDELQAYKAEKAKGEGDKLTLEKLKFENAKVKMNELAAQLRNANVHAPVSGTIILSELAAEKDKKGKVAEKGTSFSQGDILLSIGNTEGISVSAEVDEMEIMKIKKDQEVVITGDAFPGVTLKGKVYHLSSQAGSKGGDMGGRRTASFEITITVDKLSPEEAEMLRLGMSANISILILNKPGAILIPVGAVRTEGADRVVMVRDKQSKQPKKVKVETGITTVDSVEILKGVQAGDEVMLQ
ncbi:MAG TPA: HlyD family efflux transporter periplasmic adaptor subunit [Syntrophales bacterium]|nr:HlyD family efflux transporter periplasmic adaptor subunit [Syntrophales bacterium]